MKSVRGGFFVLVLILAAVFLPVQVVQGEAHHENIDIVIQAFETMLDEATERAEASPYRLLRLLTESLTNGMTQFHYAEVTPWMEDRADITLFSNLHTLDFGLHFALESIRDWGFEYYVEFMLYLNPERAALALPQIDDTFFGVHFDTLYEDLSAFVQLAELEMHEFIELMTFAMPIIDILQSSADEVIPFGFLEPYKELLFTWLATAEMSAHQVTLDTIDMPVTRIAYNFSPQSVGEHLHGLADMIEADSTIRGINQLLFMYGWTPHLTNILNNLREDADLFIEALAGDIIIVVYLDSHHRLVRAELIIDVEETVRVPAWAMPFITTAETAEWFSYEIFESTAWHVSIYHQYWRIYHGLDVVTRPIYARISLDFGQSVHDVWLLELYVYEADDEFSERISYTWAFESALEGYHHTFTTISHLAWSDWSPEPRVDTMEVTWQPESGAFAIGTLEGIFLHNPDGSFLFRYAFEDFETGEESFVFALSGQPNVEVPAIDFKSLGQWGELILEWLERAAQVL
ncbi:MAG: hypothetical protein FWE05_10530 [Defluviitaleaceae bacterium]|nr:hypothetical protein [Defluviitaleaceae bacterium]